MQTLDQQVRIRVHLHLQEEHSCTETSGQRQDDCLEELGQIAKYVLRQRIVLVQTNLIRSFQNNQIVHSTETIFQQPNSVRTNQTSCDQWRS